MIDEVISGDTPSTTSVPTTPVSDVLVELDGPGVVALEAKTPSGGWVVISTQSGAYTVNTPDTSISYRIKPRNIDGSARVYMT